MYLADRKFSHGRRRKRAYELQTDLEVLKKKYDELKKDSESQLSLARDKMNAVLKEMGFASLDDLDKHLLESTTGDVLQHWKEVSTLPSD